MKKVFIVLLLLSSWACSSEVSRPVLNENQEQSKESDVVEKTVEQEIQEDIESKDIELALLDNNAEDENAEEILHLVIFEVNDEDNVLATIEIVKTILLKYGFEKNTVIDIKDKDKELGLLATYRIDFENDELKNTYINSAYYTNYQKWINSQFSVWNGQHDILVKLVKSKLNDEKSFDHISTTYRVIIDEDTKNEVNNILKDGGYTNTVEINDLIITMEFSAKNGFNATIKNIAIGIASYNLNTITLVDFGS